MTPGTGFINFGAASVTSDYFWKLGYLGSASVPFNSHGKIWHLGDIELINENSQRPGNLIAAGDVTAYKILQSSDSRLKKNISTIDNGLKKINAMRGVNYQLLRDNTNHVGLIAQEVEKVVPEVVTENSDGMKAVNYGAMVSVLIEAVKELSQEVESLKAKLGD